MARKAQAGVQASGPELGRAHPNPRPPPVVKPSVAAVRRQYVTLDLEISYRVRACFASVLAIVVNGTAVRWNSIIEHSERM